MEFKWKLGIILYKGDYASVPYHKHLDICVLCLEKKVGKRTLNDFEAGTKKNAKRYGPEDDVVEREEILI